MKITEGTWEAVIDGSVFKVKSDTQGTICYLADNYMPEDEIISNMRLLAASKKLYKSLKMLHKVCNQFKDSNGKFLTEDKEMFDLLLDAEHAIRKAEGKDEKT